MLALSEARALEYVADPGGPTGLLIKDYLGAKYHLVNGDRSPEAVLREIARLLESRPRMARRTLGIPALDGCSISMA
jgi:hypothetical protein